MKPDEEWGELQGVYRGAPEVPIAALEIVARARRKHWLSVGEVAVEIVAYLGAIGVFIGASIRLPLIAPFASFVVPAFAVALAYSLHVRWGTWRRSGQSVAAHVELEWRRKRADVRLLVFGRVLLGVLILGFAVWVPYLIASKQGRIERVWPIAFALLFSVVTLGLTWVFLARRHRTERLRLDALGELRAELGRPGA